MLGPWIVTPDELGDPQTLNVEVRVNGETRAKGATANMLFPFPQILAYASQDETIHAGEVFGSGTVGNCCGLEIGRFLNSGDEIELHVDRIGVLRNHVVASSLSWRTNMSQEEQDGPSLIDISVPLENDVPADLARAARRSNTSTTSRACRGILPFFPGLKKEDLPDGKGWAVETVKLSTHNGTHLDAPWHYHPTMNEGERSWTIDEVPLDWCFQPASSSTSAISPTAMSRPPPTSRRSSNASAMS